MSVTLHYDTEISDSNVRNHFYISLIMYASFLLFRISFTLMMVWYPYIMIRRYQTVMLEIISTSVWSCMLLSYFSESHLLLWWCGTPTLWYWDIRQNWQKSWLHQYDHVCFFLTFQNLIYSYDGVVPLHYDTEISDRTGRNHGYISMIMYASFLLFRISSTPMMVWYHCIMKRRYQTEMAEIMATAVWSCLGPSTDFSCYGKIRH